MLWLAIVVFLSLAISVLRGGHLINLGDIRLRGWWMLVVAVILQAGTIPLPRDEDWAETLGVAMILISFGLLMILIVLNRERPGMWLAGIGVLMNFTVIALNGGMPVMTEAALVAGGFSGDPGITDSFMHVPLDDGTRLTFFADVIPLRLVTIGQVISLGDVFLAVGLGRFLEYELRRPRRLFKKGASGAPGSAVER